MITCKQICWQVIIKVHNTVCLLREGFVSVKQINVSEKKKMNLNNWHKTDARQPALTHFALKSHTHAFFFPNGTCFTISPSSFSYSLNYISSNTCLNQRHWRGCFIWCEIISGLQMWNQYNHWDPGKAISDILSPSRAQHFCRAVPNHGEPSRWHSTHTYPYKSDADE